MTQDLEAPLFEGFKSIYFESTPEETVYPGIVSIKWKQFESELKEFILDKIASADLSRFKRFCFVSYGCIAYPKESVEVEFRLFGLTESGVIPCDEPYENTPTGYLQLATSSDWNRWGSFVHMLNSADRTPDDRDSIWQEQMEEQYNICALKALRSIAEEREVLFYSGFWGETGEEWINRANDLPKNV
ncbi:hypothetical protein BTA51_14865 [Hahella sp. CCB-MM4]|uniref:hypothetical protein n=1 Tax=Hahella sp. (strain CCB-MM4) TaxID=1926491 RepID=UPI000B9A64D4|nr:hypothetical protein [Hahella sp. CCB-MM4]OZG72410.1 hypothetical protein BTA51_14865 [Hahella sp. CCB-MM4]